ncbi:MAG: transcription regulator ArsR [Parcubacteria group bacterium Greene0714_7]|nr:MAG: transcription regulator ArsR [Parcubacteria group bacterium Greene0714_7]
MQKITYKKIALSPELTKRARLLSLAGDETRVRILCFMFEYGEACVSDIAESLDMPVNTVSHHLRMMKDNGFFASERMGTNICYKLVRNSFINNLEKAICKN